MANGKVQIQETNQEIVRMWLDGKFPNRIMERICRLDT